MNDFLLVVGISALAAVLTFLGAPLAERFDVPNRIVSGALQFAAGIITALVVITLMPPAIRTGPYILTVFAFFVGGVLYVLLEYYTKRVQAKRSAGEGAIGGEEISLGLFIGILVDLFVDGVVIGIGSTLNLLTGSGHGVGYGAQYCASGIRHHRDGETARDVGEAAAMAGENVRHCTDGRGDPRLPGASESTLGTEDGPGGSGIGLPYHDRG